MIDSSEEVTSLEFVDIVGSLSALLAIACLHRSSSTILTLDQRGLAN